MITDIPSVNDNFESLEIDRNEILKQLEIFNIVLKNLNKLYNKHDLYLRSVIDKISCYSEAACIDIDKTMLDVDQKLWDYAFTKSGIERIITHKDKEDLRKKYLDNPPIYEAVKARQLIDSFQDNSKDIATRTIKKVFDEIVKSYYKTGNNWRGEKKYNNSKKIEIKFRKSCFGSWPRSWLSDSDVAFFNDLEIACSILNNDKVLEYPNRIGDKLKDNCRKSVFETENFYFICKMFKNGNTLITFKNSDLVKMLNQYGSNHNMIGI